MTENSHSEQTQFDLSVFLSYNKLFLLSTCLTASSYQRGGNTGIKKSEEEEVSIILLNIQ